MERTGVWIVGARGDVAVTAMVGARAIARGLAAPVALVTELPELKALELPAIDDLVFAGCDVRTDSLVDRAWQLHREHHLLEAATIQHVAGDLAEIDGSIAGAEAGAITAGNLAMRPLRAIVEEVRAALRAFRERSGVSRVVVVNLASTEPPLADHDAHDSLDAFDLALEADVREAVSASVLYAYAALDVGCAYVNFTPSRGARLAALHELALARRVPYCGNDGKTGETLVKTALAPMFRCRNLHVLSWVGYNMLGNSDGRVLADPTARASKVESKGKVLREALGYEPHATVGIEYVPSVGDWKLAWDFIHFEGFLGTRMSLQFTWQGCDSALAAPLVLDLIRLGDLAMRRGEIGYLGHTACFFKDPIGVAEQNLAVQFQRLVDYASNA
jgi:myo-inositol-1-phosphate synthase